MNTATSNKTENLRMRAEDLLARAAESFQPADIEDINKLHQELAVHQAELELQNEELQDTQASLRRLRDRYIELFENAPVGYVLLDASGIIRRTNSTWSSMLGRADTDYSGIPFAETLIEGDDQLFLSRLRSFFNNPAEKHMELRIKRHNAAPFYAHITAKRSYDEDTQGDTDELMVIVSDITAQKHSAEALREQRDLSESLIETAPALILVLDTRGCIVRFNPYMEELVGYKLYEVKGLDWFETFIPSESGHTLKPVFEKTIGDIPTSGTVNSIRTKDGRTIVVEWNNKTLKDKDGGSVGVLAIGQDITARQQAENYREMGREILQVLNESGNLQDSIKRVLAILKERTMVDAVGLRLQEGEDFPYFAEDGFPVNFLQHENSLVELGEDGGVCRDKDGNICLECTCGLVLSGRTDPSNPLFTQGGSCWANDSFPLLELPSEQDPRTQPRNNCIHQGYASVALIPIKTKDRIAGLIQLNDKRKDRFTLETIEQLEDIAAHIGSALMRKQAEEALRESEATVRKKLRSIVEPGGDISALDLADIIDVEFMQSMMEDFYHATGMLGAVLDLSGNVLVAFGWQDICTKFHRRHADTLKNCIESDTILSYGVAPGEIRAYKCKNNLWDVVTPLMLGDEHVGNVFIGQFFYTDEMPDEEVFRVQARKYGFDETEYLAALSRVPRFSREEVDAAMQFYVKLTKIVTSLSYNSIKQARMLAEQQETQKKLSESEERFKALHNASFGGIVIHDQGMILDCNQGMSEMSGFDYDELIGMDGLLLIAEESRKEVMNNIRSGYEKPYEAVGLRKNGDIFPMRLEARIIPYHGKTVRVVEFRDITEQKEAEAEHESLQEQLLQSQKMESVGLLAGGVAHDFNNMLGVIIGHAEMQLRRMREDDPGRKSVDNILIAARRSADLTRQLLAFARKQPIAPEVLNLNETVEGMLKMLRRIIGEDIELVWNPGSNIPAVSMDPSQLDQILVNLCVNARDAIQDVGTISLETEYVVLDDAYCNVHNDASPGEYILLVISDNGWGMDEEVRLKIFDPFYTTKEQGKGTGLGLSTVYGIVKQNGGFINVYSEPGRGTTFRIYIPIHHGEADADSESTVLESIEGNGETILLVEDEPALLDMTCSILEELGYRVIPMGGPSPALAEICTKGNRPDLVITDVVMPGMNGKDMAGKMLQTCPEIKVLFMSGYTSNTIMHHGVLEKGVPFIQKPFSVYDLGMKVRDILRS